MKKKRLVKSGKISLHNSFIWGGLMNAWKVPSLLISGIGISNLGSWIYLIAINLSILNLTGSAAAVAGLYIIRPIAMLMTNTWAGSVIDRMDKKKLMIYTDVFRGGMVAVIPFLDSLWFIYLAVLLINMAGSFFGPSSSVYITKMIPSEKRKRFNSIMGMASSGAFLTGPAVAGFLIMHFGTDICIFINAVSFIACGFILFFLPELEEEPYQSNKRGRFQTIVDDWRTVFQFGKKASYFMAVYVFFQAAMLIGFALDSQEATFIKQHLELTDQDYGIIVSLTGLGALAGAAASAALASKMKLGFYMGTGMLMTSVGYLFFYSSNGFMTATLSFVFLGFFMAFANSGYATFFQLNVPVSIMGRFGSAADMLQGIVQIILTLLLGLAAEWFTLQTVCLVFSGASVLFAAGLLVAVMMPSKASYFDEKSSRTINA